MSDQTEIGRILRDFEDAAKRYRDREIEPEAIRDLHIHRRLAEHIQEHCWPEEETQAGMIRPEELSEANRAILQRAMCCLIGGLNSREIEAERDFQRNLKIDFDVGWPFVRLMNVLEDLRWYFPGIPDENLCVLIVFVSLLYEKYQIDDIWDQVERRRELLDLSRRVREIGDAFLRTQMS